MPLLPSAPGPLLENPPAENVPKATGGGRSAPSGTSRSGRSVDAAFFAILAAYAILFAIVTWPLALHPVHFVGCDFGDGFVDMLLFWYAAHGAMFARSVHSLFYPWGVALGPEKGFWLVPCMAAPFIRLLPLPFIFNLLCATFFVATAASLYALLREQDVGVPGAFVGGALFVLSPAYLNELSQGIPENLSMQWLVLFLLFGLRTRRRPDRRNAMACGFFFSLSWLASWYVGLLATLFAPLLPLRRLRAAAPVALILLLGPFTFLLRGASIYFGPSYDGRVALDMIHGRTSPVAFFNGGYLPAPGRDSVVGPGTVQLISNSTDLSALFARHRDDRMRGTLPGILLIALAVLGAWKGGRRTAPWLGLALLMVYLSLGPMLIWNGRPIGFTLTQAIYQHVALADHLRPVRFLLGATLALAVLAGFSFPRNQSRPVNLFLVALLIAMNGFEGNVLLDTSNHVHLTAATVPASYRTLPHGPLIDLPLLPHDLGQGQRLYAQTVHHQPMLDYDFVSPDSLQRLGEQARANSLLASLLGIGETIRRVDAEALRTQGFRTLILHARMPAGEQSALFPPLLYDTLERLYGPPRTTSDGLLIFNMQTLREGAWNADGTLAQSVVDSPPRRFSRIGAGVLGTLPGGDWDALRLWMRGAGARIRLMAGTQTLGESAAGGANWRWMRIHIQPASEPALTLRVDVAAHTRVAVAQVSLHRRTTALPHRPCPPLLQEATRKPLPR